MNIIKIDKLDHQGRGIGKYNKKTIFVNGALPGEEVEVDITLEKKKFYEGNLSKLITPSPLRIKPICPVFKKCGGCDLMHISYEEQIKYKENKVKEILKKFTDIEGDKINEIIGCDNEYYYRNKITFQVKDKIGLYGKKSYELITFDRCYIANKKINKIYDKLKILPLDNINQIVVRTDDIIDEIMIVIYASKDFNGEKWISILKDDCSSIVKITDGKETVMYGNDHIIFELGEYKFKLSPTAFFQVNTKQCEELYNVIVKNIDYKYNDVLLDLYCGAGTIGIYLNKYFKYIYGIEINEEAVKNAISNKELNKIDNIEFTSGAVGSLVRSLKVKPSTVIVDPPRKGLDIKTIKYLQTCGCGKLIYVSCDPVTLARDIKLLTEVFEVESITPVDMFPQTCHIECVSVLHRKKLEK